MHGKNPTEMRAKIYLDLMKESRLLAFHSCVLKYLICYGNWKLIGFLCVTLPGTLSPSCIPHQNSTSNADEGREERTQVASRPRACDMNQD